jgi:hypothetical protein
MSFEFNNNFHLLLFDIIKTVSRIDTTSDIVSLKKPIKVCSGINERYLIVPDTINMD